MEEREWIDLLHRICLTNSIRTQYFHPSAFVNGVYSCCARSDENAPGCKNVSAEAMDYFQMDLVTSLDPALDLQRIHTLIMSHMPQLDALLDPKAFQHLQQHNPLVPTATALQQQSPQLYATFQLTIEQLRKVAYVIDKDHRDYKQGIARELKYGSRQAPIGDDNYLQMVQAAGHLNVQQYQQQQTQAHQQQKISQQNTQVLPQMQQVMAIPYSPTPMQMASNMNAYFMHNLQPQQQRLNHQQQQQQLQQQQQQQQHLMRASAMIHHTNPSSSSSSTSSSAAITPSAAVSTAALYMREANSNMHAHHHHHQSMAAASAERYANKC